VQQASCNRRRATGVVQQASCNSDSSSTWLKGSLRQMLVAGTGSGCIVHNNNIDSNTGVSRLIEMTQLGTLGLPVFDASNNWWGTTDVVALEGQIFDYQDDFAFCDVVIAPVLAGPEPTAGP
jgi:hypothetical protein